VGCRELLDQVIPLNEEHLRRLVREYISYFHEDRIQESLGKDTPNRRPIQTKPCPEAKRFRVRAWVVSIIAIFGSKPRSIRARSASPRFCRCPQG
jgi:hypothetical protein